MAGEMEEPVRLEFKADSFLSGSISFGRFESEDLCWERRSSFSHNRYLEEVEKCSKPGSVTEKKAILEAHFRKKGDLGLSSPVSRSGTYCQTIDNGSSDKTCYDDGFTHTNEQTYSPKHDERMDSSVCGSSEHEVIEQDGEVSGSSNSDARTEYSCDSSRNVDCFSEREIVEEEHHAISRLETEAKEPLDHDAAAKSDTVSVSNTTIGLLNDNHAAEENRETSPKVQQVSSSEEIVTSLAEHVKPGLVRRVSATPTRRYVSGKEVCKGSDKRPSKSAYNIRMKWEAEKKTKEATVQDKYPKQQTPKHEPDSKAKAVNVIKSLHRNDRESRNKLIQVPRSSASREVPSRVRQSEDRIKPADGLSQRCIKQDSSRFSFKCNERAERRKEFDMQLEEKIHAREAERRQLQAKSQQKTEAEIKQLRKTLNFKATPLPSFYHEVIHESDRNKSIPKNIKPRREQTKPSCRSTVRESSRLSSTAGMNKSKTVTAVPQIIDPAQTSEATSCRSTVTSDSSPSSPAAELCRGHRSEAVASRKVGGKKEREMEKFTSVNKHKSLEGHKIYKGKTRG